MQKRDAMIQAQRDEILRGHGPTPSPTPAPSMGVTGPGGIHPSMVMPYNQSFFDMYRHGQKPRGIYDYSVGPTP